MASILWLITILLVVMWFLGYAVNIGGWINFLLVAAVILLLVNVVTAFMHRGTERVVHEDTGHRHHHDDVID